MCRVAAHQGSDEAEDQQPPEQPEPHAEGTTSKRAPAPDALRQSSRLGPDPDHVDGAQVDPPMLPLPMRGSSQSTTRSATRFKTTKAKAMTTTTAWTTVRSRASTES